MSIQATSVTTMYACRPGDRSGKGEMRCDDIATTLSGVISKLDFLLKSTSPNGNAVQGKG
ncbi:hypothetical protein PABG_04397 [Paracoccidioides brasiliensis Pb03]|uniref:Uncharacterized protein n=1 Tax=Paracoccidioides brasiliensis (strain Pb18) TaxID=502780 RepID=A0A0A0HUK4_PARBD|nr:uncharacterized protein PADG_11824 [Paracoccidioides brasiliensis Pb18]EEH22186.1 hypothetical protein PABG_04397 [Paracoccidioides brasiliensis Pb03]KGM92033.1 hypothetical protein PADG_11824 [Paracoccidioides brasiliensis Pb18]ODH52617.1 hypothetical protein GX48_01102 [Paracoccidioides brasiliensis]